LTFGLEIRWLHESGQRLKPVQQGYADNWCIGFSRRYTVGVWVGNFSGAPMKDVSGISGAAPVCAM